MGAMIGGGIFVPVALGLGALLVLVLGGYVVDGLGAADPGQYTPAVVHGAGGLVTATAYVFVSYAGIGEVASVAEEVTDPGRNLPRAMVISIGAMILIYTAVVGVVVGVVSPETLLHGSPGGGPSLTPMADGANALFGGVGVTVIAITAVLALTSMANAGVLGTSRFITPRNAVLTTGAVLLLLIRFVPVVELAKLASAFLILVFSLENVSVILFRESGAAFYDPEFRSPGYPTIQIVGVLAGAVLILSLGTLPIVGAIGIIGGGAVWYWLYGRRRTDRVGALYLILRRHRGRSAASDQEHLLPGRKRE